MPLARVTLMLPAWGTRPDAVISGLVEATWQLLIPIERVVPPPQALFDEAIWTFHAPSYVAAAPAGVAAEIPLGTRVRPVLWGRRARQTPRGCFNRGRRPPPFFLECYLNHTPCFQPSTLIRLAPCLPPR